MAVSEEQVFEYFDNANLLQISEFIKKFEDRYGVSAAAPAVAVAAGGPAAGGCSAAQLEANAGFRRNGHRAPSRPRNDPRHGGSFRVRASTFCRIGSGPI